MLRPVKLGHIVLRVRDLERSKRFYTDVLGLRQTGQIEERMAFFSCGQDSHDLAVIAIGPDAAPPEPGRVGLYHFAYQVATAEELGDWHAHLKSQAVTIIGTTDHGVALGIYFLDPDGNELEVTYEKPASEWPQDVNPFAGDAPLNFE
ncbi:MAG: VOC family protein [Dehalococcoidia bacterium]|nr:VOC family protein [Dehalococcoidia bacterium]